MRIERKFTKDAAEAYAGLEFATTTSEIRNPDGKIVFRLEDFEVPAGWSQVACDVLAQKYFRKAGIARRLKKVAEKMKGNNRKSRVTVYYLLAEATGTLGKLG